MGKEILKNRGLDPKLRRLVMTAMQKDEKRLRADFRHSVVQSTETISETTTVSPDILTKRVLVRLRRDAVPQGWDDLHWVRLVDGIYACRVPVDRLEDLGSAPEVEYVESGRMLSPFLQSSVPETRADALHTAPANLTGQGVVVGIIDFGFDFTLDDFRHENGDTRAAFLWDQSLTAQSGEHAPAPFGYGVEYDATAIDQALQSSDPFAAIRHDPGQQSHGTHVAGTAAGNGRSEGPGFPGGVFIGAAPEATIVFVQPAANDQNTTFADSVHVAEAIAYVFAKADELGLPCVINMSLGQNGGSHDGESIVERAIDRLLEQPGRAFVVAGGNEHLWRGHASGTLDGNEQRTLQWQAGGQLPIPGGGTVPAGGIDRTPNEMEIWYSSRDSFQVRVTGPDGGSTALIDPGETEFVTLGQNTVFVDSERFSILNGDARIYIEVSPINNVPVAAGIWRVEIVAQESRDGRFDAWIERDARSQQNLFADQSFFAGADFDGLRTLGTPSTSRRGISVANYDHGTVTPSDSSGRGRTRDGRGKPEVAAPGTNIVSSSSLGGRTIGGNPVPMRTTMSGTSMAAPHVAGIVALLLQHDNTLTAPQLRSILIASANTPLGTTDFDVAWGYGRVDAQAALDLLK